jgi:2-dehydro-3-deoxygalactonokinase
MPPRAGRQFLSCDWGTSHFRLKWVDGGKVLRQIQDEDGCKRLHQSANLEPSANRSALFEEKMQIALEQSVTFSSITEPVPLIISGMASSSIGWKDVPYARVPIPLDGSDLKVEILSWKQHSWISATYLISGITTDKDMMRGEETEAIGLLSSIPKRPSEAVLLLPGTHSKHLKISDDVLRDIQTYMTGELYAVLSRHSVLAASVAPESPLMEDGFLAGIDAAMHQGFAANVFQTRARQVLRGRPPPENASFLSGLLIGTELKDLGSTQEILLGGAPPLRELYGKALKHLGVPNWRAFSDAECENAVVRGHEVILAHLQT